MNDEMRAAKKAQSEGKVESVPKNQLAARARGHGPQAEAFAELLADRHSCRAYRPDPVPKAIIDDVLTIVQLSASWCNSQPWQTWITSGNATIRFRTAMRAHAETVPPDRVVSDIAFPTAYRGIYKDRQRECGWQLYESVGIAFGDREASRLQTLRNFDLFDAPHVMIVTSPADLGAYGAIDCGGFVNAFMLAAMTCGIGTIAQAALAMHSDFLREWFEIPKDRLIVCGVSFGYPQPDDKANAFRTLRSPPHCAHRWIEE